MCNPVDYSCLLYCPKNATTRTVSGWASRLLPEDSNVGFVVCAVEHRIHLMAGVHPDLRNRKKEQASTVCSNSWTTLGDC